jgi:Antp family, other
MSSYQFVNTLAQCYAAEQTGQTQSQNSQDYYNMNYPNCYSPNLAAHAQYGQYSSLMMSNSGNNDSGGGPESNGGGNTASEYPNSQNAGQRGKSANQSPAPSNNSAGPPCKYSEKSPQDLSRTSDGDTCPSATTLATLATTPKTPDTPVSTSQPLSPLTTASPGGSSVKDVNTDRGTGSAVAGANGATGGNSNIGSKNNKLGSDETEGKASSTSNPPQIYPWMKRVHLGQSKSVSLIILYYVFVHGAPE